MTDCNAIRRAVRRVVIGSAASVALVCLATRGGEALAVAAPESAFFSTTFVAEAPSVTTDSRGDLWPSCWSSDGNLYAANGDGPGFGSTDSDVVVNRISGSPAPENTIAGRELAHGSQVGTTWASPDSYNLKPTGMLCVDGTLYLAVQDLNKGFNDAPNATIARSNDHGSTWTWNHAAPMFSDHVFTTIMFLDYGKDGADNPDPGYVYAYGLDHNWRDSFDNSVPDPVDLYLARIPKAGIQDVSTWQYSTGPGTWSDPGAISQRVAVLHDDRHIYPVLYSNHVHNLTVLGQGGVVYDKPLGRYIYSSWTEYTFEFYEAPQPWGPWTRFMTKDFGGYPWTSWKNGGYATSIPSKFISRDGKSMWLQANVCTCGGGGDSEYDFTLRRFEVTPFEASSPTNVPNNGLNLARRGHGTRRIERVAHHGNVTYYNDGVRNQSEDDWNDERKTESWWGYVWPRQYRFNRVVYTTGRMYSDGGWFAGKLRVQVRQGFEWRDVSGLSIRPRYPYSSKAGPHKTYTFSFSDVTGDGIRIVGMPGGAKTFTSIGELAVCYGSPRAAASRSARRCR